MDKKFWWHVVKFSISFIVFIVTAWKLAFSGDWVWSFALLIASKFALDLVSENERIW